MEKNVRWYVLGALVAGAVLGYVVKGQSTTSSVNSVPAPLPTPEVKVKDTPATGWDLHIDAEKHFPGKDKMVAHHRCKQVSGMTECQLYASDEKDAPLVGVEMVVDPKHIKALAAKKRNCGTTIKRKFPR